MDVKDPNDSGRKSVWLTKGELEQLFESAEQHNDMRREIALRLMGECGLRSAEVLDVTYEHIESVEGQDRYLLKVPHGKGDKERKTIISAGLRESIKAYSRANNGESNPVIECSKRTLTNWVESAADEQEGDGWEHVSCHDLRRSFGTNLLGEGVSVPITMSCGGWDDYQTFKQHYVGEIQGTQIAEQTEGVFA